MAEATVLIAGAEVTRATIADDAQSDTSSESGEEEVLDTSETVQNKKIARAAGGVRKPRIRQRLGLKLDANKLKGCQLSLLNSRQVKTCTVPCATLDLTSLLHITPTYIATNQEGGRLTCVDPLKPVYARVGQFVAFFSVGADESEKMLGIVPCEDMDTLHDALADATQDLKAPGAVATTAATTAVAV